MSARADRNHNRVLSIAWLLLSAVTLLSWWIGSGSARAPFTRSALVTYAVLGIAAIKVRVIVSHFMEVKDAPVLLKRLMDGWLALMIVALLAIYSLQLSMPLV